MTKIDMGDGMGIDCGPLCDAAYCYCEETSNSRACICRCADCVGEGNKDADTTYWKRQGNNKRVFYGSFESILARLRREGSRLQRQDRKVSLRSKGGSIDQIAQLLDAASTDSLAIPAARLGAKISIEIENLPFDTLVSRLGLIRMKSPPRARKRS